MKYSNLTMQERNQLAKQYEPLVNKLTRQFSEHVTIGWMEIKSMAYEGLALAIEKYDDDRSNMNFTQYAAFSIRNNILTCLDNESRTVKMSNYAQKKAIEAGESLFTSVSIDRSIRQDDENRPIETKLGMVSNETFSDGNVFDYLYVRLEEQFCERDCKMFYMAFGLKDENEEKGKDIAKMMGVSEGLVSQKVKKIVTWIRKDNDLCEMLSNLLER
jgi:RNA polymerase sigma factor (sigma-70 family)